MSRGEAGLAFINAVQVLPAARRQRLARRLMRRAIDHATAAGCAGLRLETYSCLTGARRLYVDLGFRLEGEPEPLEKYGQRFEREFWRLAL